MSDAPEAGRADGATGMDPGLTALFAQMGEAGAFRLTSDVTPEQVRQMTSGFSFGSGDPTVWGTIASTEELTVRGAEGDLPARLYRPVPTEGAAPPPLVIAFHGGGWVLGDLESYDGTWRLMCAETGAIVVAVDYRLAPEHPFPAAPEDAVAATHRLRDRAAELGADPERVAVAGDSAGGNLSAVVARSEAGAGLVGQLLIYPSVAGGDPDFPSRRENRDAPMLGEEDMRWFDGHYAGDRSDERFAPLSAASLAGVAPAVVGVAGLDPLRDEGIAYAEKLEADGVPTVLRRYDGLVHGFVGLAPVVPAADRAARELCRDLRRLLDTA